MRINRPLVGRAREREREKVKNMESWNEGSNR